MSNYIEFLKKEVAYLRTQTRDRATGHIWTAIAVLEKRIESLLDNRDVGHCYRCEGRGIVYETNFSKDDVNPETCPRCNGNKYIEEIDA